MRASRPVSIAWAAGALLLLLLLVVAHAVRPRAVEVVTLRLEGFTVARIDVVPAAPAHISCRAVSPDQITVHTAAGRRCSLAFLVPRTGPYRIEISSASDAAGPYTVRLR